MTAAWLEAFLAATSSHQQQAMPASAPQQQAAAGDGCELLPHHLLQLASAVPHLPTPPPRAWQTKFVLAAMSRAADFTGQQAAQLLHALAGWQQHLAAHMASGGSSAEEAAAAHSAFASCLPLYDSLMLIASRAGSIAPPSVGTANGGLSLQTVQVLPASLRTLQWPADEQVVQTMQSYIAGFRQTTMTAVGKIEGTLQTRKKQLQQLQDADAGSSKGGSKKERKGSSRSKLAAQPGGSSKQQQAQLQEVVAELQHALDQAAVMLQQLDDTADDWQQLLQPTTAGGGTGEAAAATATVAPIGAVFSRGGEDRMVQGLDIDSLMSGMMQAAGMPQPAAAAAGYIAGSGEGDDVAVESELDDVLGGLALLAEVQGAGWGLLLDDDDSDDDDDDDDEGQEDREGGQQYIDTIAEDVV
jgi:hypothetical protein